MYTIASQVVAEAGMTTRSSFIQSSQLNIYLLIERHLKQRHDAKSSTSRLAILSISSGPLRWRDITSLCACVKSNRKWTSTHNKRLPLFFTGTSLSQGAVYDHACSLRDHDRPTFCQRCLVMVRHDCSNRLRPMRDTLRLFDAVKHTWMHFMPKFLYILSVYQLLRWLLTMKT